MSGFKCTEIRACIFHSINVTVKSFITLTEHKEYKNTVHEEYKISNKVDVCVIKCICTYTVCGFVEVTGKFHHKMPVRTKKPCGMLTFHS